MRANPAFASPPPTHKSTMKGLAPDKRQLWVRKMKVERNCAGHSPSMTASQTRRNERLTASVKHPLEAKEKNGRIARVEEMRYRSSCLRAFWRPAHSLDKNSLGRLFHARFRETILRIIPRGSRPPSSRPRRKHSPTAGRVGNSQSPDGPRSTGRGAGCKKVQLPTTHRAIGECRTTVRRREAHPAAHCDVVKYRGWLNGILLRRSLESALMLNADFIWQQPSWKDKIGHKFPILTGNRNGEKFR